MVGQLLDDLRMALSFDWDIVRVPRHIVLDSQDVLMVILIDRQRPGQVDMDLACHIIFRSGEMTPSELFVMLNFHFLPTTWAFLEDSRYG